MHQLLNLRFLNLNLPGVSDLEDGLARLRFQLISIKHHPVALDKVLRALNCQYIIIFIPG